MLHTHTQVCTCAPFLSNSTGRCAQRTRSNKGCVLPSVTDSTDAEDSVSSSQKSSLSTQKVLNPLPAPEKYRKRRMPGGRFQGPADQECLSCLEESLSRQNSSEGRSERTFSHVEVSEPEEQRPHSTSGAREVSGEQRGLMPQQSRCCSVMPCLLFSTSAMITRQIQPNALSLGVCPLPVL